MLHGPRRAFCVLTILLSIASLWSAMTAAILPFAQQCHWKQWLERCPGIRLEVHILEDLNLSTSQLIGRLNE